uniref:Uncharacterized protein n=1 Tax=Lactuca sativa TaxID=4236 RepID=A0A9R1WCW6_LACSA|nr:hypothetical protein LSAT_V11C200098900 [Lactuca sativa]
MLNLSWLNTEWSCILNRAQLHMSLLEPFMAFKGFMFQILSCKDYTVQHLLESASILRKANIMVANCLVRSLLEKMIEYVNSAYLGILERKYVAIFCNFPKLNIVHILSKCKWVYEGVIDDPHDEFFIAKNKSLQKFTRIIGVGVS